MTLTLSLPMLGAVFLIPFALILFLSWLRNILAEHSTVFQRGFWYNINLMSLLVGAVACVAVAYQLGAHALAQ